MYIIVQVLCRAVEGSGTFGTQQVLKNERGEEVGSIHTATQYTSLGSFVDYYCECTCTCT